METKRHLFGIGVIAAVTVLASCQQEVLTEIMDTPASQGNATIGFTTNSANLVATRAENSNADAKNDLEKHHESFAVWGFKNVVDKGELTSSLVFGNKLAETDGETPAEALISGESVTYNKNASGVFEETKWEYSPARFWDKMADTYYFYAAAPQNFSWKLYQNLTQIATNPGAPGTEVAKPSFPELPEQPWQDTDPGTNVTEEPTPVEEPGEEPVEPTPAVTMPDAPDGTEVTAPEAEADPTKYPAYLEWKAYNEALAAYNTYKELKDKYDNDKAVWDNQVNAYNKYLADKEQYRKYVKYQEYQVFINITWPAYLENLQAYNEWRDKYIAYNAYMQNNDKQHHALSYIRLYDFTLNGDNASTDALQDYTKTFKSVANDKDIMIAEPNCVTNAQISTNDAVNLDFIHILSRLNISVYKDEFTLGNADVTLNQLEVRNMKSKGSFNENATLERVIGKYNSGATEAKESIDLMAGTSERWDVTTDVTTYKSITGFAVPSTKTLPNAPATAQYKYVLQSLVIPQNVQWDNVNLDGTLADEAGKSVTDNGYSDAYLCIAYSITTKEMEYSYVDLSGIMTAGSLTAAQAAKYFIEFKADENQKATVSRKENGELEVVNFTQLVFKKVKDGGKQITEDFTAYYNLASIFAAVKDNDYVNGEYDDFKNTEMAVFCEGWQNNIHFTIRPDAILLDADVYEWADKETVNPILN